MSYKFDLVHSSNGVPYYDVYESGTNNPPVRYPREDFEAIYDVCDCCGFAIEREESIFCEDDGSIYCDECAEDELIYCDFTNEFHFSDNMILLEDTEEYCFEDYARRHFYRCYHCNSYYKRSYEGSYDDNDDWYCQNCFDNGYGYFYNNDDCDCLDDYHYSKNNRTVEFYNTLNETREIVPHMGFELEVDKGIGSISDAIDEIRDLFPEYFFSFESDSSLDNGWENISQPASLSWHLDNMHYYKNMFNIITNEGFKSHDSGTCGFHIHIDKSYFGDKLDSSEAKLLYLFQKHWDCLLRFSRRTSGQVSDWAGKYDKNYEGTLSQIVKKGKSGCLTRYRAVNLTNSNTIEIRLWRGTMNPETFEATLKFTARLAEICKTIPTVQLAKMSFSDLLGNDSTILSYWERVKDRTI